MYNETTILDSKASKELKSFLKDGTWYVHTVDNQKATYWMVEADEASIDFVPMSSVFTVKLPKDVELPAHSIVVAGKSIEVKTLVEDIVVPATVLSVLNSPAVPTVEVKPQKSRTPMDSPWRG